MGPQTIAVLAALMGACTDAPAVPPAAAPSPPARAPAGPAVPLRPAPPAALAPDAVPSATWPSPPMICRGAIERIDRNRGGSSITFRLGLADRTQAAFKPDQTAGHSRFRAEIAAYRLSERLGYGRVPPSCERTIHVDRLRAATGADDSFLERLDAELRVGPGDRVRGAAISWVEGIRTLDVSPERVGGHALEGPLSDMILFDELIGNWDRWSGGNVFTDASGRTLVLIDNAAAFGPIGPPRRQRMDRVLDLAGSPSPSMLRALARLTSAEVDQALGPVGYGVAVAAAVIRRRDRMLGRIAAAAAAR